MSTPVFVICEQTISGTTCQQFAAGTEGTLTTVNYSVKSGKIGSIQPGVFFYWVNVSTATSGPPFTIVQSITTGNFTTLFAETSAGSAAYDAQCNTLRSAKITSSGGTVTVNGSGIVFIGIKYSTKNLVGATAPSPGTTVGYTFSTTQVAGSTQGLSLVKKGALLGFDAGSGGDENPLVAFLQSLWDRLVRWVDPAATASLQE